MHRLQGRVSYNAMELYITDPLHKATFLRFSGRILTGKEQQHKGRENRGFGKRQLWQMRL